MTSSHSNKIDITCGDIESIQYIVGSLTITDGQPSSPPPGISRSGDTWTIDMACGRKGSKAVADAFVQACGGAGQVCSPSALSDATPGDLNFFFGIRVGFRLGSDIGYLEFHVGQGHRASRNNWWIGGKCVANGGTAILVVPSSPSDGVMEVYTIEGGVSDLTFSPWLKPGTSPERPAWLKRIPDNRRICDINLPGTHDSAAINAWISTPYACHSHTLSEQLRFGVRLLDIRLSVHLDGGVFTFITCHGHIGLNEYQPFPSALDECRTFLSANPSEFIAMTLKVDDWNGVDDKAGAYAALEHLLDGYPVCRSADMQTLGAVRGHLYLLNRINGSLGLGVPIGWPDNTPGDWAPDNANRSFALHVQDKYNGLGNNAETAEQEKARLFIAALPASEAGDLSLDFASAVQVGFLGVYIADRVLGFFGSTPAGGRPARLGWTLFDYITSTYPTDTYGSIDVLQLLIASNFGYEGFEDAFRVNLGHDEL